jgi:hypothetical protein
MKLLATHTSPTLAAALAAGAISLSVFLIPGAAIQSGPTPLLPELGAMAARVHANLPVAAHHKRPRPVARRVFAPAHVVSMATPRVLPRRVTAAPTPRPVHRRARVHRIHRVRRVEHPVVVAASVAAPTPVVTPLAAETHARGHERRSFSAPTRAHGHGRALGHSTPRGHGRGLGHEKHAPPAAPASPPAAAPSGNGHGHGNGAANGNGNGHQKGER